MTWQKLDWQIARIGMCVRVRARACVLASAGLALRGGGQVLRQGQGEDHARAVQPRGPRGG
eukprot:6833149-Alexandrium_andersonii.AAC.1